MPRQINPYHANAGQYDAIGQGINNLAQMFLNSGPDPVDQARVQQASWAARANREKVLDSTQARAGRGQLGDLLQNFDPTGDHRGLWATGVGTGALDVDDLANLQRGMLANFGGDDSQLARAFVGAGDAIGEDDAFSLAGRDQVAARNHGYDVARDQATPSLDQALGMAFSGGDVSLPDIYSAQHPNRYALADKYRAETGQVGVPDSRDEVMAHLFMTEGPEAAGSARPQLYGEGSAGSGGGNSMLDATRLSGLEEDAYSAIYDAFTDMGMTEEQYGLIPNEILADLLDGAVQAAQNNTPPRSYVRRRLAEMGAAFEPGEDRLIRSDVPPALSFTGQPAPQPAAAPDSTLQDALAAVQQGADANAVRERLYQMGYTDDQLSGVGL